MSEQRQPKPGIHPFQPSEADAAVCANCPFPESATDIHAGVVDWDTVPWTEFKPGTLPANDIDHPLGVYINSRYQVNVYKVDGGPFGDMAWLSIKARDRQARHDWRDMQRIKNEIIGEEFDAVEIYPAESRLVDTANQFHLWVFIDMRFPLGFDEGRVVCDGSWNGSRQRPWAPGERPLDCMTQEDLTAKLAAHAKRKLQRESD